MKQDVIVIDLDRCIGCKGGCQVACKNENIVSLGPSRSKFYTMGPTGLYPNLAMYFLPLMCQQCQSPTCAMVCPTGACYKDEEDGVIYIDRDSCIGCQSCMRACPYEAIIFNNEMRVADKCDICRSRRERDEKPACVRNCSSSAIYFGDINDPDSEVSKLIEEAGDENVYYLEDKGNQPAGCFILRNDKWIDELPHEFVQRRREAYKND